MEGLIFGIFAVFSYVIYNMVYIQMYHRATRVHIEHLSSVSSVCVFAAQSFVVNISGSLQ